MSGGTESRSAKNRWLPWEFHAVAARHVSEAPWWGGGCAMICGCYEHDKKKKKNRVEQAGRQCASCIQRSIPPVQVDTPLELRPRTRSRLSSGLEEEPSGRCTCTVATRCGRPSWVFVSVLGPADGWRGRCRCCCWVGARERGERWQPTRAVSVSTVSRSTNWQLYSCVVGGSLRPYSLRLKNTVVIGFKFFSKRPSF